MQWLRDNCADSGVIRVSNRELESVFEWSHQYTQKILSGLISAGYLEELQKGTGRRATKYRLSISGNQNRSSGNHREVAQHVPSYNQKSLQKDRFTLVKNRPLFGMGLGENAQPNTHIRKRTLFKNAANPLQRVSTRSTPFNKFRTHWDKVDEWKATDFVCYFSYVHRVRFGETPDLSWPVEVGCARTLLRRLRGPEDMKAFIQIAFALCKQKPYGLRSFVYNYFYVQVINADDDYIDNALDEYDDECVFPWVREKMREQSTAASREYTAKLVRQSFGIYN